MGFLYSANIALWCLNGILYEHDIRTGSIGMYTINHCIVRDKSGPYHDLYSKYSQEECETLTEKNSKVTFTFYCGKE